MKKQPSNKTKICSVCGIRKPLSSFVIDSTKRLKEYSEICQSCRSKIPKEADDDEGGGKGKKLNIDFFAKKFMAELHEEWLAKQKELGSTDKDSLLEEAEKEQQIEKDEKSIEDKKDEQNSKDEEAKLLEESETSQTGHRETGKASKYSTFTKISSSSFSTFGGFSEVKTSTQKQQPTSEKSGVDQKAEGHSEKEKIDTTRKTTQEKTQNDKINIDKKQTTTDLFRKEKQTTLEVVREKTPGGRSDVITQAKTIERYYKNPNSPSSGKQLFQKPIERSETKTEEKIIPPQQPLKRK